MTFDATIPIRRSGRSLEGVTLSLEPTARGYVASGALYSGRAGVLISLVGREPKRRQDPEWTFWSLASRESALFPIGRRGSAIRPHLSAAMDPFGPTPTVGSAPWSRLLPAPPSSRTDPHRSPRATRGASSPALVRNPATANRTEAATRQR